MLSESEHRYRSSHKSNESEHRLHSSYKSNNSLHGIHSTHISIDTRFIQHTRSYTPRKHILRDIDLKINIDDICSQYMPMMSCIDAPNGLIRPNRMVAICFNKKSILSVGTPTPLIHVKYFNRKLSTPGEHCELNALKQIVRPKYVSLTNYTKKVVNRPRVDMIVIRKNSRDEYTNSKPCKHCTEFLQSDMVNNFINLRRIIYYDESLKSFVSENASDLYTDHVSIGYRTFNGGA